MNATLRALLLCLIFLLPLPLWADDTVPPRVEEGILSPPVTASAADMPPSPAKPATAEIDWEFDPYYTAISYTIPLTNSAIPEITGNNEFAIYRQLLQNALTPRFVLFEAAVFPLPLLGAGIKQYAPDFYRSFNVGNGNLNLMQAVTAGLQEPYAISVFFGDLATFSKTGQEKVSANKGYMGYLFSYSNQHLKRNVMIPDNVLESEWKLKGDRIFAGDKLSWSFRIGAKIHDNPDISNTAYIGFRRSHLDLGADFLSFLSNSSFDFRWDFSVKDGAPLRQEYIIGKKIPLPRWRLAMKLDTGIIWEAPNYYTGRLHDSSYQSLVAIIRPNIEF